MGIIGKITWKQILTILLDFTLLLFMPAALAETTVIDAAASEALLAAHPGYTMAAQTQWGDTAAAVLSKDTQRILCVTEKKDDNWIVTIDNPTALHQDEPAPTLLLDTDTALYWRYQGDNMLSEYSAQKQAGVWGTVSLRHLYNYTNGSGIEYQIDFSQSAYGKVITKTNRVQDENENLLYETVDIPIPAESLAPYANLSGLNIDKFPGVLSELHDWTNAFIRQSAAEQLMPEDTYLGGTIYNDSFGFLVQKQDGEKVFAGVTYNETDGWMITESTPLPENTQYGRDNFQSSLCLSQEMLLNVDLFANGTWGVCYIYATPKDGSGNEMICFGQNWIADSCMTPDTRYFGTHPWNDVTTIDWDTLPMHLQGALQQLDQTGWAMINNPNREDQLPLRTQPNKDADSLGKYYNGTAVQMLEDGETWVKVSILGVEGYMMKQYLAHGDAMNAVASAGPYQTTKSQFAYLYRHPRDEAPIGVVTENDLAWHIIGVVGAEWYHVWFVDSGLSGYIRQADLWDGNG